MITPSPCPPRRLSGGIVNRSIGRFRLGVMLVFAIGLVHADPPVTPRPLPQATALLHYIESLPQRADKRVISGQFVGGETVAKLDLNGVVEALADETGQHVGLIHALFFHAQTSAFSSDYRALADRLIDYWNAGGLIYAGFRAPNPLTGGSNKEKPYPDLIDVITPGTDENARYLTYLNQTADVLLYFQAHNAVVLCELFNEITGGWSWWGERPPEDFVKLYRYSVDYLVKTRGVRNALVVWEVTAINLSPALIHAYYPGNDYVDIVGVSWYSHTFAPDPTRFTLEDYEAILDLGKPFAFTEMSSGAAPGTWDNRISLDAIRKYYPACTFFIRWGTSDPFGRKWTIRYQNFAYEMMNDPWIANRADIDDPLIHAPPRLSDLSIRLAFGSDSMHLRAPNSFFGHAYFLQASTDLANWHDLSDTTIAGDGQALDWSLPGPESPNTFYRITENP